MAQLADCKLLISELKSHEKFEESTDSLISELRRKGLFHEDVSGSSISERAEILATYLNRAASNSCSFCNNLLEILEIFPAFNYMAVKYRNNTEFKNPHTATDSGDMVTGCHLMVGSSVDNNKQDLFSPVVNRLGEAGGISSLNLKSVALIKQCDDICLEKEELLKYAGQVIEDVNKKVAHYRLLQLSEKLNKLRSQIDEAQWRLKGEELEEVKVKFKKAEDEVATLRMRVNQLELEKGSLQNRVNEQELEKEALQMKVDELEESLETKVNELESEKESVQMKVHELDSEKEDLQTRVNELVSDTGPLTNELESEKRALQRRVNELESKREALQMRVSELESEKGVLQMRVAELHLRKEEDSLPGRS